VQRLCELPLELVVLAVHRLVLVLDIDVLAEQLSPGDEEAESLERALDTTASEDWEEFHLIARDVDVWDDVYNALMSLDRDHHDRLRDILEQCCAMSTEYISGQGGLFQVLTADEMLDSDVAAARDDRRAAEGFISAADARAFLELARRGGGDDERDAITRAYFRALDQRGATNNEAPRQTGAGTTADVGGLMAVLREAEVIAPATGRLLSALPASPGGARVASLFEQAMTDLRASDAMLFSARVAEVGYLVNVWSAGGAHDGRRPRPMEALEMVLKTCETGLRAQLGTTPATAAHALTALAKTPADTLFRRGLRRRA
jgi:hypothetical protein